MRDLMLQFSNNIFIEILMLAICADTLLGVLRAIKFRQFNSSVGIDGAIRKLAEKMIDAIVKVMKPSTGITYNRGVVTKTQSNGADWYGVVRGAVSGQLHRNRRKMARFVMITLLSMVFMIIPRNVFSCRNRRI